MTETVQFDNIVNYRSGDTSAIKAADQLTKGLRDTAKATDSAKQSAVSFSAELAKVDRANQLKKIVQDQAKFATETGNSATAVIQLTAELEKLNATQSEITAAAAQFRIEQEKTVAPKLKDDRAGDISTGLSSIASVTGVVGTNPLTEALRLGGDTAGALEYFKVLKTNILDAGKAAADGGGLIGAIAGGLQSAGVAAGGAAAGLGALAIAAAPFILLAAGVVAGITAINNAYADGAKSGELYANSIIAGTQARLDAQNLLESGDAKGLQEALASTTEAYTAATKDVEAAKANLDRALADQAANKILGVFSTGFDAGQVDTFQKALDEANAALGESRNALYEVQQVAMSAAAEELLLAQVRQDALGKQIDTQRQVNALVSGGLTVSGLNDKIRETQQALDDELVIRAAIANQIGTDNDLYRDSQARVDEFTGSLSTLRDNTTFVAAAANDAAAAEKQHADAVAKSTTAIQALNAQTTTLIANADAAAKALEASRNLTDTRASEDATRQQARADADLKATLESQAQAHAQKLISIEADGNAKVADLRAQLAAKIADAAAAIAAEQSKGIQEQIKAQQSFNKTQARQLRDFELEKKRIIEDAGQAQKDALLSNDVTALLRSQADTAKRLSRGQEDFNTKRGDQTADFAEETAARQAATQERINALNAELESFKAATATKITEEQASIQARLQAEQDGYTAQLEADQARRDLINQREAEDTAIRQSRLEEDRAIQDAASQAALQKSLDEIDQKRAKELEANGQALDGYTKLQTAATLFNQTVTGTLSALQSKVNAAGTGIATAASGAFNATPVRPFAEGGVIKAGGAPILGLFERKQDEAVIPLPSGGFGGFGGGGMTIAPNITINAGGDVSGDTLATIKAELTDAVVYAGKRLISGVLTQAR